MYPYKSIDNWIGIHSQVAFVFFDLPKAITSTGKPLARTIKVYRIENGELRSLKRRNGEAQELTTNLLEAFVKRPHRVLSRDASWTY